MIAFMSILIAGHMYFVTKTGVKVIMLIAIKYYRRIKSKFCTKKKREEVKQEQEQEITEEEGRTTMRKSEILEKYVKI